MVGDGVEIQVEGDPPFEPQGAHRVEPALHQLRIAARIDAGAVLGQKGALGADVKARKQSQPFVKYMAHHMTVTGIAEQLQGEQRAHRRPGWDHLRAGKTGLFEQLVEGNLCEAWQE